MNIFMWLASFRVDYKKFFENSNSCVWVYAWGGRGEGKFVWNLNQRELAAKLYLETIFALFGTVSKYRQKCKGKCRHFHVALLGVGGLSTFATQHYCLRCILYRSMKYQECWKCCEASRTQETREPRIKTTFAFYSFSIFTLSTGRGKADSKIILLVFTAYCRICKFCKCFFVKTLLIYTVKFAKII